MVVNFFFSDCPWATSFLPEISCSLRANRHIFLKENFFIWLPITLWFFRGIIEYDTLRWFHESIDRLMLMNLQLIHLKVRLRAAIKIWSFLLRNITQIFPDRWIELRLKLCGRWLDWSPRLFNFGPPDRLYWSSC